MTDPVLISRKLGALAQRVERARALLPAEAGGFSRDRDLQELVAFNFLLATQEALDIAARVIADRGWGVPDTAREHFVTLAEPERGLITPSLARDLGACVGARNLIAHAYGTLDVARLHGELPAGLDALEAFAQAVAVWVDAEAR